MNIKNINKHRPIPFWSWNDKLNHKVLIKQIEDMHGAGISGYIMHARGGLETEYMSEDWFDAIDFGTDAGRNLDMQPFAYDENGWPSGFGNGMIPKMGDAYQQKYLRFEKGFYNKKRTIANVDGYHFFYEVNEHYVDLLSPLVSKEFIDKIYKPYLERNKKVEGFFTDEPQLSRCGYPWSTEIPGEYYKEYGEPIFDKLPELFFDTGSYEDTREKYWRLITKLFSKNFFKPLGEFMRCNNLKLTGHLLSEDDLTEQLTSSGSIMPHLRFFDIPGMDLLGRDLKDNKLVPLQISSVAAQFNKEQVLSECYAMTGWGISFDEILKIFNWQAVRGITLICNHLEAYSLRGIRKRDYPPSIFYQQPWWKYYNYLSDYFGIVGYFLAEGKEACETLLIHPMTSAWISFNGNMENNKIKNIQKRFNRSIDILEEKHLPFHLGDETVIAEFGKLTDGVLCIGECRYKTVVLIRGMKLFKETEVIIENLKKLGGRVIYAEEVEDNDVCDNKYITYTKRIFDDFNFHFFVNSTNEYQEFTLKSGDSIYDAFSGKLYDFKTNQYLYPGEALIVFDKINGEKAICETKKIIRTEGDWQIASSDENVCLLDKCDCYFNGELIGRDMYILDIGEMANTYEKYINIRCEFHIRADYIPENLYLAMETPEYAVIRINGCSVDSTPCDIFIDAFIKKIDISGYLHLGDNVISVEYKFGQDKRVYDDIKVINEFEVIKNKFSYSMEIEAMYLVGNFSLKGDREYEIFDDGSLMYTGRFTISRPLEYINPTKLVESGYPFFAGNMILSKTFELTDTDYRLNFANLYSQVAEVYVNKRKAGVIFSKHNSLDISAHLNPGRNLIEISAVNSLRNLLGPHHTKKGDCKRVLPMSFYKKTDIWGTGNSDNWSDGYCFIKNGFEI